MRFMYQHVPIWIFSAIAQPFLSYMEEQPLTATDVHELALGAPQVASEQSQSVENKSSLLGITEGIPHLTTPYLHFILP